MPRCVLCGGENDEATALCLHHVVGDHDWALFNRLFCDFIHRGVVPPRPPAEEPMIIAEWPVVEIVATNADLDVASEA